MTTQKNTVEKFSFNNTNTNDQEGILIQLGREWAENFTTIEDAVDRQIVATFECRHREATLHQNVVDALTTENKCIEWMITAHNQGTDIVDLYNRTEIVHFTDRAGHPRVVFVF